MKKKGENSFETPQIFKQAKGQAQYLILFLSTYPLLLTHFSVYDVALRYMH